MGTIDIIVRPDWVRFLKGAIGVVVEIVAYSKRDHQNMMMRMIATTLTTLLVIVKSQYYNNDLFFIDVKIRTLRSQAPYGARRFLQLAYCGDLDGLAFYRAVRGCLAQFGLPAKRSGSLTLKT